MSDAADHHQRQVLAWNEKHLQQQVIHLARWLGWWTHHHYDSRRSEPGWPDLVMLRGDRALFRELKTTKGRVTQAQGRVLGKLADAGLDAEIWRPRDWLDGTIRRELQAKTTSQRP